MASGVFPRKLLSTAAASSFSNRRISTVGAGLGDSTENGFGVGGFTLDAANAGVPGSIVAGLAEAVGVPATLEAADTGVGPKGQIVAGFGFSASSLGVGVVPPILEAAPTGTGAVVLAGDPAVLVGFLLVGTEVLDDVIVAVTVGVLLASLADCPAAV